MPLADTAEYECSICQGRWTEYSGLMHSADEDQRTDRRLCDSCGDLTDCHHPSRNAIDPELHEFFNGNIGRVLDYLSEKHELVYAAWTPELRLPSPRKIERICHPLAEAGLVQCSEDRISMTAAGAERLTRYSASHPCGACGKPYPPERRCPSCGCPLTLVSRGCVDARYRPA